jgi:predicted lactoylglutathione lyase
MVPGISRKIFVNLYGWSFQDPDGHIWAVVWVDPAGPPR